MNKEQAKTVPLDSGRWPSFNPPCVMPLLATAETIRRDLENLEKMIPHSPNSKVRGTHRVRTKERYVACRYRGLLSLAYRYVGSY
jgi:hypothetical protein